MAIPREEHIDSLADIPGRTDRAHFCGSKNKIKAKNIHKNLTHFKFKVVHMKISLLNQTIPL